MSNLRRLISSPSPAPPAATIISTVVRSSNTLSRLISTSTENIQTDKNEEDQMKQAVADDDHESKQEVEDEDEPDINKETGEIGGPRGPEPTRFGDWERNGRCSDF
uniref:succinate dehydrogenase assembly factor 4, mitochondrial n=1 Tax=Erigeron canadensis TaxID=72917 RepID=UPI001CB8EB1C|nr:succinate dehydrogenase assembly factor 4, mitochondrial [Erigeron canadensis]